MASLTRNLTLTSIPTLEPRITELTDAVFLLKGSCATYTTET